VEGQIGRWKRIIGDSLRFHTDEAQAAEVTIAVEVLNGEGVSLLEKRVGMHPA
jgi:hypothetical protein